MANDESGKAWTEQLDRLLGGTTEMLSRHVEGLDRRQDGKGTGTNDVARLATAIATFVRAAATVAVPTSADDDFMDVYEEVDAIQGLT